MIQKNQKESKLDPFLSLPVPSPVASLCFVAKTQAAINNDTHDSDSDSSEELEFRSSMLQKQNRELSSRPCNLDELSNRFLVSCHHDGESLLWDLSTQKNLARVSSYRGGKGLAVKRTDVVDRIIVQTRDPAGIVSIHSIDRCDVVREYETFSQTFCQAAPCEGNSHLIALPSRQDSTVTVVDDRDDKPVVTIPIQNHGMLTSLAMTMSGTSPILACGMESGTVVFQDLSAGTTATKAEYSFSSDPVLDMDLCPSEKPLESISDVSVMAIVGSAGDAAEVAEQTEKEQGRVALLKVTHNRALSDWNFRMRARLSTCRVDEKSYGKPGVSICRFRPGDGRFFAIGGWDSRVRIFDRSRGSAMAIMKGHTGSVNALDWAPDSISSGLFASTGSEDSHIYLWKCFAKS